MEKQGPIVGQAPCLWHPPVEGVSPGGVTWLKRSWYKPGSSTTRTKLYPSGTSCVGGSTGQAVEDEEEDRNRQRFQSSGFNDHGRPDVPSAMPQWSHTVEPHDSTSPHHGGEGDITGGITRREGQWSNTEGEAWGDNHDVMGGGAGLRTVIAVRSHSKRGRHCDRKHVQGRPHRADSCWPGYPGTQGTRNEVALQF